MADAYKVLLDAELERAFDVWSSYLEARTGEDPDARDGLRATLELARRAADEREYARAHDLVADLYEEARKAGLPHAPSQPRPCEADAQARDYAKDALPQVLRLGRRERLGTLALFLRVTSRRLQAAPGLDAATRQDISYLTGRAWMALDLAHPAAARHELDRLKALARRIGVEP